MDRIGLGIGLGLAAFAYVLLVGGAGGWLAAQRGRSPYAGTALALLLGPLGLLIDVLLPEQRHGPPTEE